PGRRQGSASGIARRRRRTGFLRSWREGILMGELIGEGVDVDLPGEYRDGRAAHAQAVAVPGDGQDPAARVDAHGAVEQAAAYARDGGGAGAGAAGQGFADAAFINAQLDGVAVDHLHEAGVDAMREA